MFKRLLALIATGALLSGGVAVGTSMATPHASAMSTESLMLGPVGLSGIAGTATVTYNAGSGMTTVKITVKNLEPMSSHPAHIHKGVCGNNGPVVAGLNNVKANAKGVGTATTTVKGSFMHGKYYINLHYGPGLALTQFTVIGCANVL